MLKPIKIILAPSILGLTPGGVADLGEALVNAGLFEILNYKAPVIQVPTLNHLYNINRDSSSHCLNDFIIADFSSTLIDQITATVEEEDFALVLGGDCSILLGIMPALKTLGTYGLLFLDAHADFYQPEKSTSGQVADMDLALITGRGPELLTNIRNLKPYVSDEHIIHIGQRDWEETQRFGSQDIRDTTMTRFDLATIEKNGIEQTTTDILRSMESMPVDGFWMHFDTDVLSDDLNPAVDYRLPGGLKFDQISILMSGIYQTGQVAGISVTIYNPGLDPDRTVARRIVEILGSTFK